MAFEVAFLLVIGVIAVACGRPIVNAWSEKMKASYKEMEPKQVQDFRGRLADVEEQVRELKRQMANVQETADFAVKLLQEHDKNADGGQSLKLSQENKEKLRERN